MARHNIIRAGVAVVVAACSIGAVAMGVVYAQQPQNGPGGRRMGAGGAAEMGRGVMMLRRGLAQLNLTDEQKTQVKGILQGHKEQMHSYATAAREARRALGDAIASDADEPTIRAKAGDLAKVQADVAVLGAKVRKEIFAVLTPDQQAKAKQLRLEAVGRMDRFMERRKTKIGGF
jgi:Spy/CpxP family protein refolding chaperone